MKTLIFTLGCLFITAFTFAQSSVSGTITDSNGGPLPGVNIIEKGTSNGTSTDFDGNYTLTVPNDAVLVISFVGFETQEISVNSQTTINVTLQEGNTLDSVQLVGSRSPKRTATDTPVAIDVIEVSDIVTQAGKIEINELLQYAAPSFNANKQSGSDGADHIDPATLRGLGPDQTLVLVNGKRRHQSSWRKTIWIYFCNNTFSSISCKCIGICISIISTTKGINFGLV